MSSMQQMSRKDWESMRLEEISKLYEFNTESRKNIEQLRGAEVVIIGDDSGSMSTGMRDFPNITRWDELRHLLTVVIDIMSLLDPTGIDLYFLNRPGLIGVTDVRQIGSIFDMPPNGGTPLSRTLRDVYREKGHIAKERKLLIFVATDGKPTNVHGDVNIDELETVLKYEKPHNTFITFIACTDDKPTMKYLNDWDKKIKNFDVVDDYISEMDEIRKKQGKNYPFSYGDYIVKTLVGSTNINYDNADEKKLKSCCTIS